MRGVKLLVDVQDLIIQHGTEILKQYLTCKLCDGRSGTGRSNRGIVHKGNCVVGRWELRKVIKEHKRHTYCGYTGGYHHSVWPNCGDEMRLENERRSNAGLPSFEWKDIIVNKELHERKSQT